MQSSNWQLIAKAFEWKSNDDIQNASVIFEKKKHVPMCVLGLNKQ